MAATTGKKEYTLKINGVAQSVKDVTKLEDALINLDDTIGAVNKNTVKGTGATKAQTAALTDEEKAAKKLADTQKRLAEVESAANKAQIQANIELRERTREVTRQIQINQLAEGSISEMGMTLTNLRNEYEDLTAAERNEQAVGGALLAQIQALDAEYKALRESTGNFRDSVGNYEKATAGLNDLKDKFELAARGSTQLSSDIVGTNEVLDVFAGTTDAVAKSTEQLAGITALASVAQEAYTAVTQEGFIQQKAAAVMDGIRAIQLKAKTAAEAASTKGTIAATIAQRIFNAVAAANPYVLLAIALVTVVGALAAFISSTDDAAEKQTKLNEAEAAFLDYLDAEASRLKTVGDARVKALERQLQILSAQENKQKEVRQLEDDIARERARNNAQQRGFYSEEIDDLNKNIKTLGTYNEMLLRVKNAQNRGDNKITLDVDLNGAAEKLKVEEAVEIVQGRIDALNRKVQIAVDLKTEEADIDAEIEARRQSRLKEDKDRRKTAAEQAKARAEVELAAVRAAEDARISLIENGYEQSRKTILVSHAREIEDLKRRLETEKGLTERARKAINDNIVSIDAQKNLELEALDRERAAAELETTRQLEDARTALVVGQADRARAVVNEQYDRQVQDLRKRLDEEKDLTEKQREAINNIIIASEEQRGRDLEAITVEQSQRRADQELAAIDFSLTQAQNKIGEFVARNKDGLKLIDVDKTRENLAAANAALSQYIDGLKGYQIDLAAVHEDTLNTLQEGTPEYVDELQKYAAANEDVTERIKKAQKEQKENTKENTKVQAEYYRDLMEKVAQYTDGAVQAVQAVFDTWNMGLQLQLDDLNASLEVLNEQYDAAAEQRETAVKNVEDLEAQVQAATGGTAQALQDQLADAMHARQEAEREEKRLAKEKEKREADIAKKEKQLRRNELIGNIAMGIANTAQGVTKALTLAFPLNLIVAALVGAAGIVQVGIMSKQLSKLAKGGEIKGPSHAQGGVRIPGTNVEVEGEEYVTNKDSYSKNKSLVQYINSQRKTLGPDDIANFFNRPAQSFDTPFKTYLADGGEIPIIENTVNSSIDYGQLAEAMGNIRIEPKVSVVDITDAQDQVTTVQELSGF